MRPHFARPWIHAFEPLERSAPWWTKEQKQLSEEIFRGPIAAHPVLVIQTIHRLPELGIPQVCMVGRSNVGKSSLINALVFGKEIARSSKDPGRTRHLFVFDLMKQLSLVDLPGYGFAKVDTTLREEWDGLVQAYLERSKSLTRVVSLIDASVGLQRSDQWIWDRVQGAGRKLMVVLTKVDKCHQEDLHRNVSEVMAVLQTLDKNLVWPYIHSVSSLHDLGLRELRASLATESPVSQELALAEGQKPRSSGVLRRPRVAGPVTRLQVPGIR